MLGNTLIKLRRKHGYSQQEVADILNVTRQTISNWECDQGAPTLDKSKQLAELYQITLDDLVGSSNLMKEDTIPKSSVLLQGLIGKVCNIECSLVDVDALENYEKMKVLEIKDGWMSVEYKRTKENSILKKEKVVKYLEIGTINGFQILGGDES